MRVGSGRHDGFAVPISFRPEAKSDIPGWISPHDKNSGPDWHGMNLRVPIWKAPDEFQPSVEMHLCETGVTESGAPDDDERSCDQGANHQTSPSVADLTKSRAHHLPNRAWETDLAPRQRVRDGVLQSLTVVRKQSWIFQPCYTRFRVWQGLQLGQLGGACPAHRAFGGIGISFRLPKSCVQGCEALAHDASQVAAGRTASITARRKPLRSLTMRRASLKPYSF